MKELPVYTFLSPALDYVRHKKEEVEIGVVSTTPDTHWEKWCFGTLISTILVIVTLISMSPNHEEYQPLDDSFRVVSTAWYPFPLFGKICIATLIVYAFQWIISGIKAKKATAAMQHAKRTELETDLTSDPLYQRAILIAAACQNFRAHVNKYLAIFEAVATGIIKDDEKATDAYYAFIVRSHRAIRKAEDNFEHVLRQQEFKSEHPEMTSAPESSSLTDLLRRLDEAVELPADLGQLAIEETLDHELTLGRIADELDGTALVRAIDEAASRAGLKPVSTIQKAS